MATVADVAKRAGVSISTAARVLSGQGYAAEKTRRDVLEAAQALGYVPNHVARSLRTRRTKTIGLLIGDIENSFYSVIAKHVEAVAKQAGYHVILCNGNDDPEEEAQYLKLLEGMRVEGVIITPTSRNRRSLERLGQKGIVIVQMDRKIDGLSADAILVDNETGAAEAVGYLIDRGHSRIGIITGPLDITTGRDRLVGYERALRERGIELDPHLIRQGSFHRDHAIQHAQALITSDPPPTAIFAANNILAEACLFVLADLGLGVPTEVSLVAFDDTPWMRMVDPPITTVAQPVSDMARTAVELLLRRLGDEGQPTPSTMVFRTDLVVRRSVAPPRGVRQVASP